MIGITSCMVVSRESLEISGRDGTVRVDGFVLVSTPPCNTPVDGSRQPTATANSYRLSTGGLISGTDRFTMMVVLDAKLISRPDRQFGGNFLDLVDSEYDARVDRSGPRD